MGFRFRMLNRLGRAARVNAARVLVALYALCVLMPVAGFAIGNSAAALHCLTEGSPVVVQTQHSGHQHEAMAHQGHADHGHDHSAMAMADDTGAPADHAGMKGGSAPACCGMMCVSAIPASLFELTPRAMIHASIAASSDAGISGEAPELLYRPPIVLLSM